jgi:hypothetical protein
VEPFMGSHCTGKKMTVAAWYNMFAGEFPLIAAENAFS